MKRMIVFLLILAALLMLCCASALADSGETCKVWYKDCNEDASQWSTEEVTATLITERTTYLYTSGRFMSNGWYVATGDIALGDQNYKLGVVGEVHLILCDGAKLNITGSIAVEEDDHLIITSGTTVEGDSIYGTGELIINNPCHNAAGIGGESNVDCGSITINGGRIMVRGSHNCAAIGGSNGDAPSGGIITINGGSVTAYGGEEAAAIGDGEFSIGSSVTINGGSVTAYGGVNGAGIGGGIEAISSSITINGGWIKAVGSGQSPGIGSRRYNCSLTVNGESGKPIALFASSYQTSSPKIRGSFTTENGEIFINYNETWAGQYVYTAQYSPTSYVDTNGADMGSARCMTIGIDSTVWDDGSLSSGSGWYRTTSSTITDRITVVGDVNLILCDGSTLTAAEGITITEGSSLTVWA